MKTMKKILVLFAVAVLMMTTISCNKDKEEEKSLTIEERFMEAIGNNTDLKNMHGLMNMSLELEPDALDKIMPITGYNDIITDLLSNLELTAEVKMLSDTPDYLLDTQTTYNLSYKSFPLLTFDLYLNDEGMSLALSNFYDKAISVDFEELFDIMIEQGDVSSEDIETLKKIMDIDFENYLEILTEIDADDIDTDAYLDLVKNYLEGALSEATEESVTYKVDGQDVTENLTRVNYTYDIEAVMNLFVDGMDIVSNDTELKTTLKTLVIDLLDEFIDSKDYELLQISKSDIEDVRQEFENDYDEFWASSIQGFEEIKTELVDELEEPSDELQQVLDLYQDSFNIQLYLTDDNKIRMMKNSMTLEGFTFKYDYILADAKDITIDHPETALNLMDFVTGEEPEDANLVLVDFVTSALKTINEGEGYQALFDDLEPYEDLLGMSVADLKTSLGMAAVLVENMSVEELLQMMNFTDDDEDVSVEAEPSSDTRVMYITDGGTINDQNMNQSTFEGLQYARDMLGITVKYLQPAEPTTEEYLVNYGLAVDTNHQVIVASGFKHAQAIAQAQDLYPDVKFILLNAQPLDENYNLVQPGPNTTSVIFDESQAAFLAGIAAALESPTGQLGFVGGMEIPQVQNYGWGFTAGVAYANHTYGSNAHVNQYIYQGSFDNVAAGQALGQAMYDSGIDTIHAAAGGVGYGVLEATKSNALDGKNVYYIGADFDQYSQGFISDDHSVVLTSAVLHLDNAAYLLMEAIENDNFPSGLTIGLSLQEGGVGLPYENMNLSYETDDQILEASNAIIQGDLAVPTTLEALQAFLEEMSYVTPDGLAY